MKIINYIWDVLVDYSEELYRFRQRYYKTSLFDRYIWKDQLWKTLY